MITPSELVSIGSVTRLHGKQGELQCLLRNDVWYDADPEIVVLRIDGLPVPFRIVGQRDKGADCILLQLKGITTEEQALPLVGSEVLLLRRDVADSTDDDDSLTWQDLTGYALYNAEGVLMGTIDSVDESTANILCQTREGDLFPLHEDLIMALDTDARQVQLNLPDLRHHPV